MALSEHYELRYLDPDEAISDFPSQWDHVIDKIDTAIHDAATDPVSLSRLPNLPASQTTSGTFADARIPSSIARSSTVAGDISDGDAATLSAAKAYTDDAATDPVSLSRLPNLPASKTTSGTFADARIPSTIARSADIPELEVSNSAGTKISIGGNVIYYDTGWRDVTSESDSVTSGRILMRRTLEAGYIVFDNVMTNKVGTKTMLRIFSGWRPTVDTQGYWNEGINRSPRADWMVNDNGYVLFYQLPDDAVTPVNANIIMPTIEPNLPSSLPGDPA